VLAARHIPQGPANKLLAKRIVNHVRCASGREARAVPGVRHTGSFRFWSKFRTGLEQLPEGSWMALFFPEFIRLIFSPGTH
jgi:hypothetical protein